MRVFSLSFLLLAACTPTPDNTDKVKDGANDSIDADGDGLTNGVDCDDEDASVGMATGWFVDGDADGYGAGVSTAACTQPAGSVGLDGDCDDANGDVHPDATEACNGLDDDCDGDVDEGLSSSIFYADGDSDGAGDITKPTAACAAPAGYVASSDDCDDADSAYHPGAAEGDCADPNDYNCDGSVGYADADADGYAACNDCNDADTDVNPVADEFCNGVDDDCDTVVDDNAVNTSIWYLDADTDGYGSDSAVINDCDAPPDYVAVGGDCDDSDSAFHPDAAENDCADPADYNCDGSTGYSDADADGYAACEDCNDSDALIMPGATEVCDGVDNDCDLTADESDAVDASVWYADADRDSFGDATSMTVACDAPADAVADGTDCNDSDRAINPDATELCDGADNNCDGATDESGASGETNWYADTDSDGFGDASSMTTSCDAPSGSVANATDCDDEASAINPDATEMCDGIDNDCDAAIDEDDADDSSFWYADLDLDGFGDPTNMTAACDQPSGYVSDDGDCDDADGDINPDVTEVCNGLDDDCDTGIDESGADGEMTWYADTDGDTFGDAAVYTVACDAPSDYVSDARDCDDDEFSVNPDAAEICNGADDNCDGEIDEDSAIDASTWYRDRDSDGYGSMTVSAVACDAPSGYIEDNTDCDDGEEDVYPGAAEICNDTDDDCDGGVDESGATGETTWYADTDGDGYGAAATAVTACDAPADYVDDATDCDDTAGTNYPGATELCDGDDNDCDGTADDGVLGTSATCPAEDCAEILAAVPTAASGNYSLDAGTYYCNMTTDGGGWTRVANDAAVYGTGYTGTYYNTEAFTWTEALFEYASGSSHAHCTYPSAMTGCNPIGFQFNADNWGVAQNWGSSVCGMSLTYYTSATSYVGGYDFVISHASTTATIRIGMLEGISSCTTGDNSGTAYLDVYVR